MSGRRLTGPTRAIQLNWERWRRKKEAIKPMTPPPMTSHAQVRRSEYDKSAFMLLTRSHAIVSEKGHHRLTRTPPAFLF